MAGFLFVGDGTAYHKKVETMSKLVVAPPPGDVFKPDIFKGKVLFCTGGGSGIGKVMTEAVVGNLDLCSVPQLIQTWCRCAMALMQPSLVDSEARMPCLRRLRSNPMTALRSQTGPIDRHGS